jgi:PTS system ascorbate-specific IIA component
VELPLPDEAVRLGVSASDWRAAIRQAGEALVAAGVTEPPYTDEMIATVEQLGPYIVIAPGVALAHSRPSPSVNRPGLSWVTLADPVEFGNADNDPVRLVVGLAALNHDGHLELMAALAEALSDQPRLEKAMAAVTAQELREVLAADPTTKG